MKNKVLKNISVLASIAAMTLVSFAGFAESKSDYHFRTKETPAGLAKYSTVVYPYYGKKVITLMNHELVNTSNPIVRLAFNPSGVNFTTVTMDKKGKTQAAVYDSRLSDELIANIDTKRLGQPSAVTYTPDARNLIVATDKGVFVLDGKKYKPVRNIETSILPSAMVISDNGYYLALSDGKHVNVYNFEEGNLRKDWDIEEGVNAIFFSDDNSMFAILSADGLLSIYDTRAFNLKNTVDDLGQALSGAFNFDGKYVGVATNPETIQIVNLLNDERETIEVPQGVLTNVMFVPDSKNQTLMVCNVSDGVKASRMTGLEPYYGKLLQDEVAKSMSEWLKMQPGETPEEYQARIKNRESYQRLLEDEISTQLANNLLSMSAVTLGKYDRANQLLEVDFNNMPAILLPVPESDLTGFTSGDDLEFSDAKYGILPNDNFELIYAKVYNKANGKTYLFDNLDRRPLSFMTDDDNIVSIEIIQQQQMEEMRLEQIRQEVMQQAKAENVISDHTHIAVNSRVVPEYDANGKRILNYEVNFSYEVEPEFSTQEDFAPGKYKAGESGAASSMLEIVRQAFEGDLSQYIKDGKKLKVKLYGTADATPIVRTIAYDGSYGDFVDEPVKQNGQLTGISVTKKDGIKDNPQLAFLRATSVRDYLEKNVKNLDKMNADYEYNIDVSEDRGSAFRRIIVNFTFVDAL